MQVFWAYIVGMLTSLGRMKLDRIHSMLKMFAVQGTGGKEFSQVIYFFLFAEQYTVLCILCMFACAHSVIQQKCMGMQW